MAREPDSLSVSTCPRRTTVENSVPSLITASAALAPDSMARETTLDARSRKPASAPLKISVCVAMCLSGGAAHCHAIQLQGRNTHTDRHRLSVFAAGPNSFVQLEIIAHHGNFGERIWTVADESAVLKR